MSLIKGFIGGLYEMHYMIISALAREESIIFSRSKREDASSSRTEFNTNY